MKNNLSLFLGQFVTESLGNCVGISGTSEQEILISSCDGKGDRQRGPQQL